LTRLVRSLTVAALLGITVVTAAPAPRQEFVQAVEFPYYLYPRTLWERELVWLKNIGIRTVEFSIPWNWHQLQPGDFDFTGRTSPRRDLAGFIKLLRRLGLRAWVRPLPAGAGGAAEGVPDWPNGGTPAGPPGSPAQRAVWIRQIGDLLAPQTARHGGPVEFVEPAMPAIDAAAPPEPLTVISAIDRDALARSRRALEKTRGAILWKDVEDQLYPAGWRPGEGSLLRQGAVGLSGDERPTVAAVRRDAALLRHWPALLRNLKPVSKFRPAETRLPDSIVVAELASPAAAAISITNRGTEAFHEDLRLYEPAGRHVVAVPRVTVPAGESLWLPVNVSLGPNGLCGECSNFSVNERLVYATAELFSIEYENGILAMEFAAPVAGEAVLQLERKPVGPFLAAGRPTDFDWDASAFRARLPIPASQAPDHRVRIGIAIEEPETSGFFDDVHRLIVGQKNPIATSYSSPAVAARSRLRLPAGFTAVPRTQSPNEIEYDLSVPADALHGDFVTLTLEADGTPLGRALPQLFRPVTVRLMEALAMHFGQQTELAPDPPTAPLDPHSGGPLEIALRNNWPAIQTYRLETAGDGLTFFPAKIEISIGAQEERRVELRVFAEDGVTGVRDWNLRVSGTGTTAVSLPMRVVLLPRNGTVAWTADLDGDGSPEYILESSKARAIFSARDGGRWMEFTAMGSNSNFLPEQGVFAAPDPAETAEGAPLAVHIEGDALVFAGPGWQRTARLAGGTLTIEQTTPLPADGLTPFKQNGSELSVAHPSANRAVYILQ
jgi:hypothetical protein